MASTNKIHSFLVEWAVSYLRHKDIFAKNIESIDENKDGFDLIINCKDKKKFFLITDSLISAMGALKTKNHEETFGIVTLNSQDNFDALIQNWDEILKFKNLSICLINPFSNIDKKWIIHPHTHNKICEPTALKAGLKSMFEMVEPITAEQLLSKI